MGFLQSTNQKKHNYNAILVIIRLLIKMIQYKPIKTTINAIDLAKILMNVVRKYHKLFKLIIYDQGSLFTLKFKSLLCYFLCIEQKFCIAFFLQTNSQIKRQNGYIEIYLYVLVNWEQNNQARVLPIAKFAYNNTGNVTNSHTFFEL